MYKDIENNVLANYPLISDIQLNGLTYLQSCNRVFYQFLCEKNTKGSAIVQLFDTFELNNITIKRITTPRLWDYIVSKKEHKPIAEIKSIYELSYKQAQNIELKTIILSMRSGNFGTLYAEFISMSREYKIVSCDQLIINSMI